MAYTPNPTWTSSTVISTAALDNLETEYDESYSYLTTHDHDSDYYLKADMLAAFWHAGNDGPGSGLDADLLYHADGNLHGSDFYGLGVDEGLIIWYHGDPATPPSGWATCDGNNGTPDMRGSMPFGAGGTANPGLTGGSATFTAAGVLTVDAHVLTITEMAAHSHPFTDKYQPVFATYWKASSNFQTGCREPYDQAGTTDSAGSGSGHGHSAAEGTAMAGDAVASLPHSIAVTYIMKLAA